MYMQNFVNTRFNNNNNNNKKLKNTVESKSSNIEKQL